MADGLPLRVQDLTVAGDRGRQILSVPQLEVAPGTALGIRGPSGAGKSTLLFALAGLAERARGAVIWGDQDILTLSRDARAGFRAARIGMIFQDFLLFDEMNAAANAGLKSLFAPKSERAGLRARASESLAHLGITGEGRNVASFSGGERQRVAIARALSSSPPVILADEPTASLHRDAADALTRDLLADVTEKGRTLIVVSHDLHLLDQMHRVIEIADGALHEGQPA